MAIKYPFGYLAFCINYLLKSLSKKEPKLKALSIGSLSILAPHLGHLTKIISISASPTVLTIV